MDPPVRQFGSRHSEILYMHSTLCYVCYAVFKILLFNLSLNNVKIYINLTLPGDPTILYYILVSIAKVDYSASGCRRMGFEALKAQGRFA